MLSIKIIDSLIGKDVIKVRDESENRKFWFTIYKTDLEISEFKNLLNITNIFGNNSYTDFVLTKAENDEILNEIIIGSLQETREYQLGLKKDEFKNLLNLELPRGTYILQTLESCLRKEVDFLKTIVDDIDYCYLTIDDFFSFLLSNYYRNLDKCLSYNEIEESVNFTLPLFNKLFQDEGEIQESIRNNRILFSLEAIQWYNEQIQNEISKSKKLIENAEIQDYKSFIDKSHFPYFHKVESKALNGASTFNSDIRCAAFCEKLYIEHYIKNTKTKRITLTAFAKARYGKDIFNALAGSKKKVREEYLSHPKGDFPPLKNAFI